MKFSYRHTTFTIAMCVCAMTLPMRAGADGADANSFVSNDGHRFEMSCNENGFVLTSAYPVARYIENGTMSDVVEGIETIFMGKSCDAFTKVFGDGTWNLSNGGFGVRFETYEMTFPRQEPHCPTDPATTFAFEFDCTGLSAMGN